MAGEGDGAMNRDRMSDAIVGAAGDVAGTVVDPRGGLGRLRSAVSGRTLATVSAGVGIGYLIARYRRRG